MFEIIQYNSYITIAKMPKESIAKIDFVRCKEPKQTLSKHYNSCSTKPRVIINGGLFNMSTGETLFDYLDEGQRIEDDTYVKDGIGIVGDATIEFGYLYDYTEWRDFIGGYPVLIADGRVYDSGTLAKELDYRARRTILGFNDTDVFAIVVESPGKTFNECRELCLTLGLTHAINLDGGGSTHMLYDGETITSKNYNRAVDNVIEFYETEAEEEPVIYRVQVGAFRNKVYANKLFENLIVSGYSEAYIRVIDNIYKVQVGAFVSRERAYNFVQELENKGFNAYITTS